MLTAQKASELFDKKDVSIVAQDLRRAEAMIRQTLVVKEDKFIDIWVHPETIPKLEELGYKVVNGYGKLYRVYF